jgi:hypothetical protein
MNARLSILAMGLTALAIISALENQVVAGSDVAPHTDAPAQLAVRSLQRGAPTQAGSSGNTIRDPFAGPPPPPPVSDAAPLPSALPSKPLAPAFPAFRVLGKQKDDDGWAVFITDNNRGGQVWVVREGEKFNETFRIGKLAPPLLIVRDTRTNQSRSFDIGQDEGEE